MFKYMSIRSKLLLLMLVVGLLSAAFVGVLSYKNAKTSLTTTIYDQLTALRETKKRQTENYFQNQIIAFEVFSNQAQVSGALDAFSASFDDVQPPTQNSIETLKQFYISDYLMKLKDNSNGEPVLSTFFPQSIAAQARQAQFISENPSQTGRKDELVQPKLPGLQTIDNSDYAAAHVKYHPLFSRMLNKLNYYDIFLIDHKSGNIVYSVYKEADYATNLDTGPYRYTGLTKAFNAARKNPQLGSVTLIDFSHYEPSYNKPAAFMATPVFDGSVLKGIVAAQLNIDDINKFMTSDGNWVQEGMGASGEVYLVGEDANLRTSSRFLIEDRDGYIQALKDAAVPSKTIELIENTNIAILNQPVDSIASNKALRGISGTEIVDDYRNVQVLSAYGPIEIGGMRWGIMAEKDVSEAMAPLHSLRNKILITIGSIAIAVTLFSLLAAGIFAKPVARLEESVARFAAGDTDFHLDVSGTDEFASLSRAFNGMVDEIRGHNNIIETKNLENERLLRTVLPDAIADRVRGGDVAIAETFENVTVVYATIGRFTEIMANVSASEMINLINELIDAFDEAAERHGVERINTVGDVYLAACGLPIPRLDHAKRATALALEMITIVNRFNRTHNFQLTLRVGLSSGEVDAGIVGKRRFVYEILGESVTVARQLATETSVNTVSIAKTTYDDIQNQSQFKTAAAIKSEATGTIERWVSKTPRLVTKSKSRS
ncbi:MAG: adenylate/guanylate cyclase domain-containing protein [Maricaulaceae bacterium]